MKSPHEVTVLIGLTFAIACADRGAPSGSEAAPQAPAVDPPTAGQAGRPIDPAMPSTSSTTSSPTAQPAPTAEVAEPTPKAPSPTDLSQDPGHEDCAAPYTLAVRARIDISWPGTIGFDAGEDQVRFWSKITYAPRGDGTAAVEATPCGVSLPVVTTTPLLDRILLDNEIPTETFDRPSMPRSTGSAAIRDGVFVTDPGITVFGVDLPSPEAVWPPRYQLVAIDHDDDGKPGITAIPKSGDGFGLPPTDIGQTQHADQVYVAARMALRLRATKDGCQARAGEVEPVAFDYAIVGCHAIGRGECEQAEADLLGNNSPVFALGTGGQWQAAPIDPAASCEQVVALLKDP